jgi:hypothetical protein
MVVKLSLALQQAMPYCTDPMLPKRKLVRVPPPQFCVPGSFCDVADPRTLRLRRERPLCFDITVQWYFAAHWRPIRPGDTSEMLWSELCSLFTQIVEVVRVAEGGRGESGL